MASESSAEELADQIEATLRAAGTPERAVQEQRYLKSDLDFLGANVPIIRGATKAFKRNHPDIDRPAMLALVLALWSKPVHERRVAAVELLDLLGDRLEAADSALVEQLIRESKTWALVDNLASNIAGDLVLRYPELEVTLDRWAVDHDFWVRRSALLALLEPLRRGGGDFERFARYADAMLDEREFFIRKAIGWVLRETSKKRPQQVYDWLAPRVHRASGVTLHEALKYLPSQQREALLAAGHPGRSGKPM